MIRWMRQSSRSLLILRVKASMVCSKIYASVAGTDIKMCQNSSLSFFLGLDSMKIGKTDSTNLAADCIASGVPLIFIRVFFGFSVIV